MPNPRCGAPKHPGPIFLGQVLSSRLLNAGQVIGTHQLDVPNYAYKTLVVETFSVRPIIGEQVEVLSGTGGADCSFHFLPGQRYLVDTWEVNGVLYTGLCGLTRPERLAKPELETLRLLASGQKVPDVMGSVGRYFPGHPSNLFDGLDPILFPAVPGINLKLRPINGGATVTARTDDNGMYRMEHVSAGQYAIEFELPKGLVNANPSWDADAMRLVVPDASRTGPMCRVNLEVGASGSVSGRVLHRWGKRRVDELVQLYKSDVDERSTIPVDTISPDANGAFRFLFLDPGVYRMKYHVRGRKDVAYPPQITLVEGEWKTRIEFRLPSSK